MFSNVGLPHGWCFLWQPGLIWLHVASDSLIAIAYMLIPLALLRIIRGRRDIPFNAVVLCFVAFILACGGTHAMDVYTLWHPVYWLSGWLKAFTAAVSLLTVAVLVRLTPDILRFPSSADVQELNHRLNSVLESTSDGILAVDFNWRVLYLNRVATKTEPGMKMLSKSFWERFPALSGAAAEAELRRSMSQRVEVVYEHYYNPYDRWFCTHAYPSADGITIFFSDITVRRKLEMQLAREKLLKEQRIEALSNMAGGLAHEISNPLSIIHARASDLKEVAAGQATVSSQIVISACGSIVRTVDRAARILRGLRGFAREGSKDPMTSCSLRNIAEQAIELVQKRFETHNVGLRMTIAPDIPEIECREVQISQILLNLLNNAFDAVDGSASIERWVSMDLGLPDGESPGQVRVDVVDSGLGVDERSRAHLMEPFFTTKAVGAGLGIGLSLSRAIAQDHHGSLKLTGLDGHTCFRLLLPVKQPHKNADAATAQPEKVPAKELS